MKEHFENFFVLIGAILIGIPLGLVVGIITWFRFPFEIYFRARSNLALKRIEIAKQKIRELEEEDQDIWEKHINRMQEKESYDN